MCPTRLYPGSTLEFVWSNSSVVRMVVLPSQCYTKNAVKQVWGKEMGSLNLIVNGDRTGKSFRWQLVIWFLL